MYNIVWEELGSNQREFPNRFTVCRFRPLSHLPNRYVMWCDVMYVLCFIVYHQNHPSHQNHRWSKKLKTLMLCDVMYVLCFIVYHQNHPSHQNHRWSKKLKTLMLCDVMYVLCFIVYHQNHPSHQNHRWSKKLKTFMLCDVCFMFYCIPPKPPQSSKPPVK